MIKGRTFYNATWRGVCVHANDVGGMVEDANTFVIKGMYDIKKYYFPDGVPTLRTELTAFAIDKTSITADGVDKATVTGLPVDTMITMDYGVPFAVTDGTFEFSATDHGLYHFSINSAPYHTIKLHILAEEP